MNNTISATTVAIPDSPFSDTSNSSKRVVVVAETTTATKNQGSADSMMLISRTMPEMTPSAINYSNTAPVTIDNKTDDKESSSSSFHFVLGSTTSRPSSSASRQSAAAAAAAAGVACPSACEPSSSMATGHANSATATTPERVNLVELYSPVKAPRTLMERKRRRRRHSASSADAEIGRAHV